MHAIEINSRTDKTGRLKIDYKLGKKDKNVRVIILIDDEQSEMDDETLWLKSISNNPAFEFLNEPYENYYSLKDGEPLND